MTKEEFKAKLLQIDFDVENFRKLMGYSKLTMNVWLSDKGKIPIFVRPLFEVLIALKEKNDRAGYVSDEYLKDKEKFIEPKKNSIIEELEYYKKILSLKKENERLKRQIRNLKQKINPTKRSKQ